MELGVGEALVSLLDEDGKPTIVDRAKIVPPRSQLGPITAEQRKAIIDSSVLAGHYEEVVDRESAYERLRGAAAVRNRRVRLTAETQGPKAHAARCRAGEGIHLRQDVRADDRPARRSLRQHRDDRGEERRPERRQPARRADRAGRSRRAVWRWRAAAPLSDYFFLPLDSEVCASALPAFTSTSLRGHPVVNGDAVANFYITIHLGLRVARDFPALVPFLDDDCGVADLQDGPGNLIRFRRCLDDARERQESNGEETEYCFCSSNRIRIAVPCRLWGQSAGRLIGCPSKSPIQDHGHRNSYATNLSFAVGPA